MEKFVKGDVIVVPFPFSDLVAYKKRPAIIAANLEGDDLILCQITSEARKDQYAIQLNDRDFTKGRLNVPSRIRPNKIFTADKSLILYKIGMLKQAKIKEFEEAIIDIFRK